MTQNKPDSLYPGAVWNDELQLPLSRWSDPITLRPGTRVIVRNNLPLSAGTGPSYTDIIGTLVSTSPLIVENASGTHMLDNPAVVKSVSAHPVRTADIRAVEQASAHAFPGIFHHHTEGWYLRASDGITERSNSAVALSPTAALGQVPLEEIDAFYAQHHLPTQLLIPERIGRPAESLIRTDNTQAELGNKDPVWDIGTEIIVMTRDLEDLEDATLPETFELESPSGTQEFTFTVHPHPTEQWFEMYHFRGLPLPASSLELLENEIPGQLGFATLTHGEELVAITRATITTSEDGRSWLGYSAVEVAPRWQQMGLGTQMGLRMMQWGKAHGAQAAYLHVQRGNIAGRSLYLNLGFSDHHRHYYAKRTRAIG